MTLVQVAVSKYRTDYRAEYHPTSPTLYRHFATVFGLPLLTVLVVGQWASRSEWPLALAVAILCNLGEWYEHRYHLHSPGEFSRHANEHHRFFTAATMTADTWADSSVVLFPATEPAKLIFLAFLLASPWYWLRSLAAAATVVGTLMLYYFSYELLHLAYHAPSGSWLARCPGLPYLRRHHQIHHSQSLMTRYNFNVTLPLTDWLCGTWQN